MTDFSGKAAIVTGASSGIGRAIAVDLARHGADLWLVGRSEEGLAETGRLIAQAGGGPARAVPLDLAERGGLGRLVAQVAADHPHLFALINNAGLMHPEPIMKGSIARWQAMMDVNVMAVLEGAQAAVTAMRGHGRPGHIVNIGSVAARWEVPGVYGATKRMVEGIGATLRQETEQDDIRIATIIPGGFDTQLARGLTAEQQTELADNFARMGIDEATKAKIVADPQHIADMVRYLLDQPIGINLQEVLIRPPIDSKI